MAPGKKTGNGVNSQYLPNGSHKRSISTGSGRETGDQVPHLVGLELLTQAMSVSSTNTEHHFELQCARHIQIGQMEKAFLEAGSVACTGPDPSSGWFGVIDSNYICFLTPTMNTISNYNAHATSKILSSWICGIHRTIWNSLLPNLNRGYGTVVDELMTKTKRRNRAWSIKSKQKALAWS